MKDFPHNSVEYVILYKNIPLLYIPYCDPMKWLKKEADASDMQHRFLKQARTSYSALFALCMALLYYQSNSIKQQPLLLRITFHQTTGQASILGTREPALHMHDPLCRVETRPGLQHVSGSPHPRIPAGAAAGPVVPALENPQAVFNLGKSLVLRCLKRQLISNLHSPPSLMQNARHSWCLEFASEFKWSCETNVDNFMTWHCVTLYKQCQVVSNRPAYVVSDAVWQFRGAEEKSKRVFGVLSYWQGITFNTPLFWYKPLWLHYFRRPHGGARTCSLSSKWKLEGN